GRAPATGVRPDWMADWMEPFARTIDAAKKYVVSSTLDRVDWNAELVRGDLNDRARISCTKRDGGIKKGNSRYKCPQDTILRTKGIPHEGHSPERPSLGQGPVAEKPPPLPQRRGAATLSDYL